MTKTNNKRPIPTVQEFYKTKGATKSYVALLLNSSLDMDTHERFIDLGEVNIGRFAVNKANTARPTFYRHLTTLEEKGFIKRKGDIIYINKNFPYALIEKDTLEYLMNVKNQNVVSVFASLQWRWDYFKKLDKPVYFTQSVLLEDLGMVAQGSSHNMIKDILNSLVNEGLIEYTKVETPKGNTIMKLTKLNKHVKRNEIQTEQISEEIEVLTIKSLNISGADF